MFSDQEALLRCIEHREIFHDEMLALFRRIATGQMSTEIMAALLLGLRVKKETVGEITAAACVMREYALPLPMTQNNKLLDIVGTGGDGAHSFNISTAAMFVAAAAGAKVAKHGGRSVSSASGSADVLEALGANIELTPTQVAHTIEATGLGFLFAKNHHPAMQYAAPVRKILGVRTLFNILGPLTNPAQATHSLIGVFHPDLVGILIRVLQRLGNQRALVVYGQDGLDEFSLNAPSLVAELCNDQISEYIFYPESLGLSHAAPEDLRVDSPAASCAKIHQALHSHRGPVRDIVALNAGAALFTTGIASSIAHGVTLALDTIASGKALEKMQTFIAFTHTFSKASHAT